MDREKVIKGVRKCLSHKPCSENGCPYENECAVEHLNDPLLRDALSLLKEQEPTKPRRKVRHGTTTIYQHWCGQCMTMLYGKPKFCPNCGKPVEWEGR